MADYGVPQNRQRVFMTFFDRRDVGARTMLAHDIAPYPLPTHSGQHVSVDQALREMRLAKLDASRPELARDKSRELHAVPVWEARRYAMVAAIPPNSGKTAWQNNTCLNCGSVTDVEDAAVCLECDAILPRPVVHDEKGPRLISGFRRSSYSRMDPNLPAATITTASGRVGGSNTIHPSQNRVLSPLECAGLQTFPENFRWGESRQLYGDGFVREVIGEAVPPRFTEAHGKVVASLLNGRRPRGALSTSSVSVARATSILLEESGLASLTE
jgi:DNA (cytosine-5)-methyltransferase 1